MEKYKATTLDTIQLASGCISKSNIFITSDKNLYKAAKEELETVKFV